MMLVPSGWIGASFGTVANTQKFGGLGNTGLAVVIIVSVILIAAVIWLINGTKKRDDKYFR